MRRIASLLVLGLWLAGNGTTQGASEKSRKTTSLQPLKTVSRFVDKNRGFSINLPSGWSQDRDSMGTAVMAISKAEGSKDNFRENINVVVETLTGSMTPKDYFDASQNAIKRVFQDFRLEKTGKERLGSKDFYWSVFQHKTPNSKAKVLQYVSVNGLRAYIITCSASPEKFDKFKGVFESSAKSFKFE